MQSEIMCWKVRKCGYDQLIYSLVFDQRKKRRLFWNGISNHRSFLKFTSRLMFLVFAWFSAQGPRPIELRLALNAKFVQVSTNFHKYQKEA